MLIQLPFSYRLHYLNTFFFRGLGIESEGDDFQVSLETMQNMIKKKKKLENKRQAGGRECALQLVCVFCQNTRGGSKRISLA